MPHFKIHEKHCCGDSEACLSASQRLISLTSQGWWWPHGSTDSTGQKIAHTIIAIEERRLRCSGDSEAQARASSFPVISVVSVEARVSERDAALWYVKCRNSPSLIQACPDRSASNSMPRASLDSGSGALLRDAYPTLFLHPRTGINYSYSYL